MIARGVALPGRIAIPLRLAPRGVRAWQTGPGQRGAAMRSATWHGSCV